MLSNNILKSLNNLQYQHLRHAHRIRGKAPVYCHTIKERLEELNFKDELYTTRINIGFPPERKIDESYRKNRIDQIKQNKNSQQLEQFARKQKLRIDLDEARTEWLKSIGPYQKKRIADHYAIFEHLYGEGYFVPYVNLEILYELNNGSYLPVCSGNVIKPAEALKAPSVSYESDGNTLWTLALTSLDGHLTEGNKENVHWLVSNIPGNSIEKGDTIAEYLQPFPVKGTGYHRYAFVLYKQNSRITYDIKKVSGLSLEDRTFLTRDWYQKYEENITPVGLAFYQTIWDQSVKDFFHNSLQMKEPIYEYDFPKHYVRPQEWFPRRAPFNLYMDKYKDPRDINKQFLLRKLNEEDPFKAPPPPLKFPNAHSLPKSMPSWLKVQEKKIRLKWGRVNDVE